MEKVKTEMICSFQKDVDREEASARCSRTGRGEVDCGAVKQR